MKTEQWRAVAALAALGAKGKQWSQILALGGAVKCFEEEASFLKVLLPKLKNLSQEALHAHVDRAFIKTKDLNFFLHSGGKILASQDPGDLHRLLKAPQPPLCAFFRGNQELLTSWPAVAIVGSRLPSPKGLSRAFSLAKQLAQKGCTVVSGGANGIDMAAHEGALAGGGHTICVLGEAVCAAYDERPSRLKEWFHLNNFATVTAFGPWAQVRPTFFVLRNQYIAALADAVVIIEGGIRSGTLHTARFAYDMGVAVWTIPGDLDDPLYAGNNFLLENGQAQALVQVERLIKSLGPLAAKSEIEPLPLLSKTYEEQPKNKQEQELIDLLKQTSGRGTLDDLCRKLGGSIAQLQVKLLSLELKGIIKRQGAELVLTGDY